MLTADPTDLVTLFLVVPFALAKPLGRYMARAYDGPPMLLDRVLGPLERLFYRLAGVDPERGMTWKTYALPMLVFNFAGLLVVYLLQRLEDVLPWNPQALGAVTADSCFNTAASFATNTNRQWYAGEATMSTLTQMLGLRVQNFAHSGAASGILRGRRGKRARSDT